MLFYLNEILSFIPTVLLISLKIATEKLRILLEF